MKLQKSISQYRKIEAVKIIALTAIFFFIFVTSVSAVDYPTCTKYVSDFANVISQDWKDKINSVAGQIEQNTTDEIAVVTIQNLGNSTIEEYSNGLFQSCRVGKKGQDNGILILASIQDKKWRIEVGYGLEGQMPDALTGRIGRHYMPTYFEQQKYGEGLYLTVQEISGVLINGTISNETTSGGSDQPNYTSTIIVIVFIAFIIILAIIFFSGDDEISGNGESSGEGDSGGGFGGGSSGGGGTSGGW